MQPVVCPHSRCRRTELSYRNISRPTCVQWLARTVGETSE